MSKKHTPGPWEVDPGFPGTINFLGGKHTDAYAKVSPGMDLDDEDFANARLIAAAPDLLEACQAVVDAQQSDDPMDDLRASNACRAAITKATKGAGQC